MKDFLAWRSEWLTVIDAINDQHREIAKDINAIAAAYLDEVGFAHKEVKMARVRQHMDHLYHITQQHFMFEDQLMAEVEYGEREEHTKEHLIMLAELRHYVKRISDGQGEVDLNLLMAIKRWFINHVIESDMEFAEFVVSKKPQSHSVQCK